MTSSRNCATCRYWSEMLAQACGGPVEAMCLAADGPHHGKYTPGGRRCDAWRENLFGAIDEPGSDNDVAYAELDKRERD